MRVHPEYLERQRLPDTDVQRLWEERFDSIRDHELHLARNGIVILKFWLHVGRKEQRKRFLARLDEPSKNWKFEAADVRERARWDDYMSAYEEALCATSRAWAPWYAIPADSKPYMRLSVARIIVQTMRALPLRFPAVNHEEKQRLDEIRQALQKDKE